MFSSLHFFLFWKYGIDGSGDHRFKRLLRPSLKILQTFAVIALSKASGVFEYHQARKEAQSGDIASQKRRDRQFFFQTV